MKRIIASAGLVALGATGLHAQMAPELTRSEAAKPWSVSAALRGFYDDNYLAAPSRSIAEDDSFGFELRPGVAVNLFPQEQTYFGASYTYSMKYYEARRAHSVDHEHNANVKLDHRFSERYRLSVTDSFTYSQQPEIIGEAQTFFQTGNVIARQDLTSLRNRGAVEFNAMVTEVLGVAVGYQNTYYNYIEDDNTSRPLSALLDRIEHLIRLDGRLQVRPDLVGILGYQYGIFDFTSDQLLNPGNPNSFRGDDRDSDSHFAYLGADYSLTARLTAEARVGAQFTQWDAIDEDEVSPYASLAATYTYLPGSYVQVGVRHQRNATDIAGIATSEDNLVLDQESTVVFGSLSHKITPRLTGSLLAQYQMSEFRGGGALDGQAENFLLTGVNVEYRFTPNVAAEAGYNFDRLDSDLGSFARSFSRNRVYVGVRATY